MRDYLEHHGILGQKWGVRRYQNPDGTLTPAGRRRLERQDTRWVKKNEKKIYNETFKKSKSEVNEFVRELNRSGIRKRNKDGKISAAYANAYSKQLAQIMNKNVRDIEAPSGRVVRFVAMRGEMRVATALADRNYDLNQLRSGVYGDSGKIAYQKKNVGIMKYDEARHSEEGIDNFTFLVHHGVLGQKKGQRNGPPYPLKRRPLNSKNRKTVVLDKNEYAHVMSEIASHMTEAEKESPTIVKTIGNNVYTVENNGFGDYRVIGKRKLKKTGSQYWE